MTLSLDQPLNSSRIQMDFERTEKRIDWSEMHRTNAYEFRTSGAFTYSIETSIAGGFHCLNM